MNAASTGKAEGRLIILVLAAISAMGSMATHMVVPALPGLAADLRVSPGTAQQVISFYLFGLAGGQLLAGPAVDTLGRRPVLLAGILLFTVAAILASFSQGPASLLGARLFQALGAAAGLVTSRVMVGDLFDKAEAARRQASLMGIVLLSPALAPVLGGLIAGQYGWRPVFWLLAAAGLAVLAISALRVPETLRKGARANASTGMLHRYRHLLCHMRFLRVTVAVGASSAALYMFLTVAPFLLIEGWGLTEEQAGLCFLLVAGGGILGTLLVGRIERHTPPLPVGLAISAAGAFTALALALLPAAWTGWPALIAPMSFMTVGAGISAPSGFAAIVHAEEGMAGTAVSLAGAIQMGSSGLGAFIISHVGHPTQLSLTMGVALAATIALFAGGGSIRPARDDNSRDGDRR